MCSPHPRTQFYSLDEGKGQRGEVAGGLAVLIGAQAGLATQMAGGWRPERTQLERIREDGLGGRKLDGTALEDDGLLTRLKPSLLIELPWRSREGLAHAHTHTRTQTHTLTCLSLYTWCRTPSHTANSSTSLTPGRWDVFPGSTTAHRSPFVSNPPLQCPQGLVHRPAGSSLAPGPMPCHTCPACPYAAHIPAHLPTSPETRLPTSPETRLPTSTNLCLTWNTVQPGHSSPSAFPTQTAQV